MAGNGAKVSAPYLGNSTTPKSVVTSFVANSKGYAVKQRMCQTCLVSLIFFWMKLGPMTIYVMH